MKVSLFNLIISLLFLSSCQFDPYTDIMTTKKPKFKDVLGIYHFKTQTLLNESENKKFAKAAIVLNADSTFTMTNVPDFVGDLKYRGGLISTKGKWRIQQIGSINNGAGQLDAEWGMELTNLPENLQYIGFTGNKSINGILITYGDPDAGAVMIFDKTKK